MDNDLMQTRNEYRGYIANGRLKEYSGMLRLDFNSRIHVEAQKSTLEGFSLRIMERPEDGGGISQRTEMGVMLTVEQWKDLIDSMQALLDQARTVRGEMDTK